MVIIDAAWSMPATGRTVVSEVVEQRRGLGDEELRDDRGPRSCPPHAAHRGGTADGHAVAVAAQVVVTKLSPRSATREPVPQPTLAADTMDGEDRFVNRRERLNGEPTARYLHADDLVTCRLR